MANVLIQPVSGAIQFNNETCGSSTVPSLSSNGIKLSQVDSSGLQVESHFGGLTGGTRFSVVGDGGQLLSVDDSLTGDIFSVNDAAGLSIINVNSCIDDVVKIGTYGTNALVVSGGDVSIGTDCVTADQLTVCGALDVSGNIAVGGTVDGRDIAADGTKLNSICCGATTCTGTGNITCITTSTGLDGSGSSGTVNLTMDLTEITLGAGLDSTATGLSLDLSELTDMTGSINTSQDEVILLDNGAERRKAFCEIFGCNAYNSTAFTTCDGTTTPSNSQTFTNKGGNISQWTNDSGYTTCIGTTTNSNTQTFTNKSGCISQWTNDSGYTTCNGDITNVSAGVGLCGGGSSGSVTLTLDMSELTDMTATMVSTDEFIVLDSSSDRRKAACEIGLGVFNNDSGFTTCTGTTTPSNSQTFTNKSGSNSQWTNDAGYTTCNGDITGVTAGTGLNGGGSSGSVTLNLDAAQTGITSILNTSLNVGRDSDNSIKFDTDNCIKFNVAGGEDVIFKSGGEVEACSLDINGSADISCDLSVGGHICACSKAFIIDHPTKPGKKLKHGAVEAPEWSVHYRGSTDKTCVTLPEYWEGLVRDDSVTAMLTPIKEHQSLYVISQDNNHICVGGVTGCYNYIVYGERKDISKLEVEL